MGKIIPVSDIVIVGNELKYLTECVETRWVSSLGPFVKKFEDSFAEYCEVKHASSVANGTAALHLSLLAKDIGKGDEVIVPNSTFVSTANAVKFCGAEPVFIDVEEKSWNLDVAQLESKISENTKAIIPVHLFGCPAEMDEINSIAKKHNLFVLEDAAEAHGAEYKGKKCGSLADASIFSFYGNKIITCGEGGMVLSDDERFIDKVNLLKDQGKSKTEKFYHEVLAYNYRFTNLQAAFGLAQLEGIEGLLQRKREIAQSYKQKLEDIEGIQFQFVPGHSKSSWWFISLLFDDSFPEAKKIASVLNGKGIDSRPFFTPLTALPFYNSKAKFPVSDLLHRKGLILPSGTNLKNNEIDLICSELKKMVRE